MRNSDMICNDTPYLWDNTKRLLDQQITVSYWLPHFYFRGLSFFSSAEQWGWSFGIVSFIHENLWDDLQTIGPYWQYTSKRMLDQEITISYWLPHFCFWGLSFFLGWAIGMKFSFLWVFSWEFLRWYEMITDTGDTLQKDSCTEKFGWIAFA